jgi:hypothetical protein
MTGGPGAKGAPDSFTAEELVWIREHLPELRRSAYGQRILYQSLGFGFVVGLAAQVGGYLLNSSVTTEPLLLVANLLYALGWALWTGVVVVVFVQVFPEVKRRQIKRWLDDYEAAQRDTARAGSDQAGLGARPDLRGPHSDCQPPSQSFLASEKAPSPSFLPTSRA